MNELYHGSGCNDFRMAGNPNLKLIHFEVWFILPVSSSSVDRVVSRLRPGWYPADTWGTLTDGDKGAEDSRSRWTLINRHSLFRVSSEKWFLTMKLCNIVHSNIESRWYWLHIYTHAPYVCVFAWSDTVNWYMSVLCTQNARRDDSSFT